MEKETNMEFSLPAKNLERLSFLQQICIHAHDVTLTDRKIAGNKTNKKVLLLRSLLYQPGRQIINKFKK